MDEFGFLNVPFDAKLGKTVYKKLFYENGNFSRTDMKRFKDNIDRVDWLYSLRPDMVNILPYRDEIREYTEVEVLQAEIKETKYLNRISEIIMRTIPYPMLLLLRYKEKISYVVSHQRTSITDSSQNVLEEVISTDFVKADETVVDFKQYRYNNFYVMYCDLVDSIILYNARKYFSYEVKDVIEAKEKLEWLQKYKIEIDRLEKQIKKESQFNRQMEINMKLVEIRKKYNDLVGISL